MPVRRRLISRARQGLESLRWRVIRAVAYVWRRLMLRTTVIAITGRSYRLKDAPVLNTQARKGRKSNEPATAGGAS